jgi:hypothetical protein
MLKIRSRLNPLFPVSFVRPGVLFISAAASSARRSNNKPEGLFTDTKMSVGFGLQAEDAESGIVDRTGKCAVLSRCGGGIGEIAKHRP